MADLKLGALEVELTADTSKLKKAEREVKTTSGKMESSFKRVGVALAAAFSFDAVRRLTLATDALQVMERRLKRFTGSSESAEKTFKKLAGTANAVGSEIKTVTSIFERFSLIREDIGATNEQIVVMTDTLAKLGAIGGSSGEEIGRALTQLSQGLAGGVLRAEEFNSIIEQAPEIAKAIGEEMGLSLGEMRKAMLDGKLTSDKVFRAILDSTEKTNAEFEKMPKSISIVAQALENDLLVAFGKLDEASGFTSAISRAMASLSTEVKRASGELSEQDLLLEEIVKKEEKLARLRTSTERQGLFVSDAMHELGKARVETVESELRVLRTRLALLQKTESVVDINKGTETEGPAQATSGELETLAERLDLRFAMTKDANLKMEAEELRFRAAILNTTEEFSEERRQSAVDLNAWRLSEEKRIGQEEADAVGQTEADKHNLRLQGLNALSGLIGQVSGLIAAGVEEGNAAAKAAFVAMQAIQVAQIIAATEASAAIASVAVAGAGPAAWLASSTGIRTIGYASAGLVAGLSVGKLAGGRRHGGLSSPNMATPINEAGVPEILEQSGKQFLLPTGKAGKVSPMNQGTSGGQPNVNIINNGAPIEVDGMNISRDEITMMISNGVKSSEKRINQSLASGRGDTFQSLQKGSRVERRL